MDGLYILMENQLLKIKWFITHSVTMLRGDSINLDECITYRDFYEKVKGNLLGDKDDVIRNRLKIANELGFEVFDSIDGNVYIENGLDYFDEELKLSWSNKTGSLYLFKNTNKLYAYADMLSGDECGNFKVINDISKEGLLELINLVPAIGNIDEELNKFNMSLEKCKTYREFYEKVGGDLRYDKDIVIRNRLLKARNNLRLKVVGPIRGNVYIQEDVGYLDKGLKRTRFGERKDLFLFKDKNKVKEAVKL